jgi:PPOX class probable F420-dependent enzyme
MTEPITLLDLADEPYVLLTTTRLSGVTVGTPVWVARHDDTLLVTTGSQSGKVKRARHTPRVTLQACDRAGTPLAGAPIVEAHATVHDDADTRATIDRALQAKYGLQFAAIRAMSKLRGRAAEAPVVMRIVAAGS